MITISKKGMQRDLEGKVRVILEIRGLSTDSKPVDILKNIYIDNGSVFIEIDTGDVFLYDMDSETWINVTNPVEPSEPSEPSEETPEVPEENVGE